MKVFISYRRDDSQLAAVEIHRELEVIANSDAEIFLDLTSINPGDPFPERITTRVAECDVLLALIGSEWLNVKDKDGVRRLENENDWVRLEIASALRRQTRVVPVYLECPELNENSKLPPDLEAMRTLHGVSIQQPTFGQDVEKLARRIGLLQRDVREIPDPVQGATNLQGGQYVYVSYPDTIELPCLRAVVRRLLAEDIPVWIHNPVALGFRPPELGSLMSERSGQTWKEGALSALNSAKCVLALVDRTTASSKRQRIEVDAAVKRGVLACAALDEDRTTLPASIQKRNPWVVLHYDTINPNASKVLLGLRSDFRRARFVGPYN